MTAFLSDLKYEHDIFVSYARVDNVPFPGMEMGWVSFLVKCLEIRINQKLGQKKCSIWIDDESLSRHRLIDSEILKAIEKSAIMLIILSPGYLTSSYCGKERNKFFEIINEGSHSEYRVLPIYIDEIELSQLPGKVLKLQKLGYHFWIKDKIKGEEREVVRPLGVPKLDELAYFNMINDLSTGLADSLKRLKEEKPAVFLTEVADDLWLAEDKLKEELKKADFKHLPETLPRNTEEKALQQSIEDDLNNSLIFIQLLSGLPGKTLPAPMNCPLSRYQYEQAIKAEKLILQWFDPSLNLEEIQDNDHREFLKNVKAGMDKEMDMDKFIQTVISTAKKMI